MLADAVLCASLSLSSWHARFDGDQKSSIIRVGLDGEACLRFVFAINYS